MTLSVVFMGTPDFSVPALRALHSSGYSIPLVITQPDRPKGRGRKLEPTPVKQVALELGLRVIQPESVNSKEVVDEIKGLEPDFFVVVAFGQLLRSDLLEIPKYGPVNIHGSLLPKYRGSAPIQRSILNGDTVTGITTMFMEKGMDTGDMLMKSETEITRDDTSQTLHDRLSEIGGNLILSTIAGIVDGTVIPEKQNDEEATYAAMLSKKEGLVDWSRPASELDCFVRGMTPWPGAYTFIGGKRLKLFKVSPNDTDSTLEPGTVLSSKPDELLIATGKGSLSVVEIQGSSGKRLTIADFLRGFHVPEGELLSSE